jgi:hypothetical protein
VREDHDGSLATAELEIGRLPRRLDRLLPRAGFEGRSRSAEPALDLGR